MTRQEALPFSRRALDRRRWVGLAMIAVGGSVLLAGVWLGVSAMLAHTQLNQARAEVHTLRAQISEGNWPTAHATARDLAEHAHRANQLTAGPIWAAAAALPNAGEPLQVIRGITANVDLLGQTTLPQLVRTGEKLNARTLRRSDGSIDLTRIAAERPGLDSATKALTRAKKTVSELPRKTWLNSIDTARIDMLNQITDLDDTVNSASLAVHIIPAMLGQNGSMRYFLAFQNEAEARGTGGLPGAFAILEANRGKVRFTRMESDTALHGVAADVDLGPDFHHLYEDPLSNTLYVNGNLSPHFPYAAQIWSSMWHKYSGERVDGVIAVDPTSLGYLLSATGPATLPDGSKVSGNNAVELTQRTIYSKFGGQGTAEQDRRRAYQLDIAASASKKILHAPGDPAALLRAAGKAANQRRLLVWSADPALQADLAQTSVGGIVPITKAPYIGPVIVNDGGNKLDYYLDRSVTWKRTGCGPIRRSTVAITLTNNAPTKGLPQYVTERSDRRSYTVKSGDNRLDVTYFATQGALMNSVTVDGKPSTASIGAERGHPVYTVDLELPRGVSRTIVLHLTEPQGKGKPIVLHQPLVRPMTVALRDANCSRPAP